MNWRYIITIIGLIVCYCMNAQTINSIGIEMADIPAGSFLMGDSGLGKNYDESPAHKVIIKRPFKISTTEVTNVQFELFMPSHKELRGKNKFSTKDDEAVIYVSWYEANEFCRWLSEKEKKNYRLPTEAEWEYACRAGSTGPYSIGDRALPKSMLKRQEQTAEPKPISLKVRMGDPNAWGIYDMHGNVEEWCMDWYGQYSEESKSDPGGPLDGISKVVRGGSHNTPVSYLRSANRSSLLPEDKTMFTGFRIVEVSDNDNLTYTKNSTIKLPKNALKDIKWKRIDRAIFKTPINFVRIQDIPFVRGMFNHNHCPAATWLPNGDILVIWFSAENENDREMTILSSRLKYGEKEWSKPEIFFKISDRNMTGSALFYDEDSGLLYHINGVEAAGTWRNLAIVVRTSSDNGYTWSAPCFISSEHEPGNQVIAGTIKTTEGYIVQACDATPSVRGGSILHISRDGGNTWCRSDKGKEKEVPTYEAGYIGHRIAGIHAGIVQLNDSSLLALGRDDNIKGSDGLYHMPQSYSKDMGNSWSYSATEFPPISSGQRLVLMRLIEGPILLISFTDARVDSKNLKGMYFDKNGKTFTGYGMYAAVSYDEGKTWPIKKLLTDGVDCYRYGGAFTGWFKNDETHAEPKGYLAATQSPDGIIHLFSSALYYQFNFKWLSD